MTTLTLTLTHLNEPRRGTAGVILRDLRARMDRWRVYRRTMSELRALSDRELDDLGLLRATIRDAAMDTAYGRQV